MGETRKDRGTPITRRTMLGTLAAAGAASALPPGVAQALSAAEQPFSQRVGSLPEGTEPVVETARPFSLVGIEWLAPATARIELRARTVGGRWTSWVQASTQGHDGDAVGNSAERFGDPLWTGSSTAVQLRGDRAVHGVRLHFIAVRAPGGRIARSFPLAQPVLDAGPGQPPILARSGWAQRQARPTHKPEYGTVKLAFVHHTVNPNGYSAAEVPSMLLAIFDYHVKVRGFWDIAYNFLIDAYGRIWEGRAGGIDAAVIGAQAGGYNEQSTGVAMLGDFMNVVPTQPAMRALERVLAWKLSLHGLPSYGRTRVRVELSGASYTPYKGGRHVSLPRIAGHRDGDLTDCPGNALYAQLPSVRSRVQPLAGNPARVTIVVASARVQPAQAFDVSGTLGRLDGTPVAGATVEVQQLQAKRGVTIATVQTAQDGSWSASVTLQRTALLRALHRAAPASVSDYRQVTVTRRVG